MDGIAVFFATSPRPSLACDGTFPSVHTSLDHNHESLAVEQFAPWSYPPSKDKGNTELNYAIHSQEDDRPKIASGNRTIS